MSTAPTQITVGYVQGTLSSSPSISFPSLPAATTGTALAQLMAAARAVFSELADSSSHPQKSPPQLPLKLMLITLAPCSPAPLLMAYPTSKLTKRTLMSRTLGISAAVPATPNWFRGRAAVTLNARFPCQSQAAPPPLHEFGFFPPADEVFLSAVLICSNFAG